MEYEFLKSLVIVFGVSALVVLLLHRLKIPSLIGFLVAGIIIGPHGIGIVKDTRSIEMLAEIGVILLLFVIGIEFSIAKLVRIKKALIGSGGVQVFLTIVLSAVAAHFVIKNINQSVFFGFLIALSSTAIVLKLLKEKGELDSPHGRIMVGILIFQDLCVVPLMLLIPVLSGEDIGIMDVLIKMGKAALIITTALLGAKWIVPALLRQVVHTKSRELFIITIILLCLGIALLTAKLGLSLALGAFLAGLIVAESEYAHQAAADILPFKGSFISLFFVSVGMLLDIEYMFGHLLEIAIIIASIFSLKIITGMFSALVIGSSLRVSFHASLGLFQVGEFSFVLAISGKALGLITDDLYQIFLSSSVVTMMVTPFVLQVAPSASEWMTERRLLKKVRIPGRGYEEEGSPKKRDDHVIIIGFGQNGRSLARVLKETEIPYVVLELNSDTVRDMKKKGEPIYYGDGTSIEILHKLGIEKARLLVIAISDPASTRSIVAIARSENPDIYIIVRARYIAEVDGLKMLGANEVIPEEFETSIEISARVLHHYHIPRNVTIEHIDNIRRDNYRVLRTAELPIKHLAEKHELLKEISTEPYLIKEASRADGHSIKELRLRTKTGATIIVAQRGDKAHQNPQPDFVLKKGDILLLVGRKEDINRAIEYLEPDL